MKTSTFLALAISWVPLHLGLAESNNAKSTVVVADPNTINEEISINASNPEWQKSLDRLADAADIIFVGTISKITFKSGDPKSAGLDSYTFVHYDVEKVAKGELESDKFILRQFGGRDEKSNTAWAMGEGPTFEIGRREFVFALSNRPDVFSSLVGKFAIIDGKLFTGRNRENYKIYLPHEVNKFRPAQSEISENQLDVEGFISLVKRVAPPNPTRATQKIISADPEHAPPNRTAAAIFRTGKEPSIAIETVAPPPEDS